MASVYIIRDDGSTEPMNRIRAQNEDKELQLILERNPDLLPGDQIDPEDPRRWLLIKREMPVPDPNNGTDRWSVDFLFADQDAMPTFVECKRFADTRARREVVGQMLEYAANGHYYWTKDQLQEYADESARRKGISLDEAVRSLQPTDDESVEGFFERVQQNLREGQLRIIFFLEESPMELRSVVDFLNKQMERSEVLLVEARQYDHNQTKIVVPTLFGYTEEARQVKRTVTINTAGQKKWDQATFMADARSKLTSQQLQAIEELCRQSQILGYQVEWGKRGASINIKEVSLSSRALLKATSDGTLTAQFGWLSGSEKLEKTRDRLRELLVTKVGLAAPEDVTRKHPNYPPQQWTPKITEVIGVLKQLASEIRGENTTAQDKV